MIIYYFGADQPWDNQDEYSINRRNMAILLALSKDKRVDQVYNVIRCTRKLVLNKKRQKKSKNSKIRNLYIAPILPERSILKSILKKSNLFLLKLLNSKAFSDRQGSVSWCYWPQGYRDYKYLGSKNKLVFDTDHNIIDDINISEKDKEKRKNLLLTVGEEAHLILSSSRSMLRWYSQRGFQNNRLVMNGVFESRIKINSNEPKQESYQVSYCGTLSKWVKVDWIEQLALDRPYWQINIIGNNYKTEIAGKLSKFKNVQLYGFLEPKEVDIILSNSNACIGLYKESANIDVNSMKIYDYLASGKPVVINEYHKDLDVDFDGLLNIVHTYEEFLNALMNPKPLTLAQIKQFLRQSSWNKRVQIIIEELINE